MLMQNTVDISWFSLLQTFLYAALTLRTRSGEHGYEMGSQLSNIFCQAVQTCVAEEGISRLSRDETGTQHLWCAFRDTSERRHQNMMTSGCVARRYLGNEMRLLVARKVNLSKFSVIAVTIVAIYSAPPQRQRQGLSICCTVYVTSILGDDCRFLFFCKNACR